MFRNAAKPEKNLAPSAISSQGRPVCLPRAGGTRHGMPRYHQNVSCSLLPWQQSSVKREAVGNSWERLFPWCLWANLEFLIKPFNQIPSCIAQISCCWPQVGETCCYLQKGGLFCSQSNRWRFPLSVSSLLRDAGHITLSFRVWIFLPLKYRAFIRHLHLIQLPFLKRVRSFHLFQRPSAPNGNSPLHLQLKQVEDNFLQQEEMTSIPAVAEQFQQLHVLHKDQCWLTQICDKTSQPHGGHDDP